MAYRHPNEFVSFFPSDDLLPNPHKGFTTFQRFNGDKLNENWTKETGWKMEQLPDRNIVDSHVVGDGYPDCTLCYFRIPWNMVEPQEGEYNFEFIDYVLNEAEKRGQKVILRFIPNADRSGPLELPLWFMKKVGMNPVRETGDKRTPIHPDYFNAICKLIKTIGNHINGDRRVDSIDISLISAWGENDQIDMVPQSDWKMLVDAYTEAFPNTPLVCQYNNTDVIKYANLSRPIGIRGDCLGNMSDYIDAHMRTQYHRTFCEMNELWKSAPINFEVCWIVKHWHDMGWDIDFIIKQSLRWHITSFNGKSARIPANLRDKMENWIKKMGYRFCIRLVDFVNEASAGDTVNLTVFLENIGVAPIYHKYPMVIRLRNGATVYDFETDADITKWLPGSHKWEGCIVLPEKIQKGTYCLEMGITDGNTKVMFATDAPRNDGFTLVSSQINIV